MRDGDRVWSLETPGVWWPYHPLAWHERANTGLCACGAEVRAWRDGEALRVQHGPTPEHVRWCTLDDLHRIGQGHERIDVIDGWCAQIRAVQGGRL